jgi:hypothetical protein
MWRLVKHLEESEQAIIGSVTKSGTEQQGLAEKLAEIWPGDPEDRGVLANAVASALWLGRRAQVLKEGGDRSAEQFFREAVMVAFETGRRSAITAP